MTSMDKAREQARQKLKQIMARVRERLDRECVLGEEGTVKCLARSEP